VTDVQRSTRPATTVALVGEVDVSTADAIRGAAGLALSEGGDRLVLDLRQVTFMDSQGISALVDAHRTLDRHGMRLVVADPPVRVVKLLALTGLDQVIGIRR
jgi:anti-sigma B factor antagonist